ncbi:alfa-L-rhamnosidase [Penicillium verhagenii]|uniref:alfa-L-rhamnosidase n=1 Tax=Penicillium verhagenii TaxID=1562060 RepID=UPI002545325F|nr:alfa-L-rhamnosidase [Penicillium verhagenii]KAJ5928701.1 alfa-L-rhamnosidase [Penicillium verhagenii]
MNTPLMRIVCLAPTFDQRTHGFGTGNSTPRISWRFANGDRTIRGWEQKKYDMQILRGGETKFYSAMSEQSLLLEWPEEPLRSRESASVRVRAYTTAGISSYSPTPWSMWATVEASLLSRDEWVAQMISSSVLVQNDEPIRPSRFRKTFDIPADRGEVEAARLYITAHGVYKAFINGAPISEDEMAPGWTSYNERLNFHVHDVTALVASDNVIAVELGEGWYASRLWREGRFVFGKDLGLLAQLEITFKDTAERLTVISDETWEWNVGPILSSEIYDGEVYDMAQEQPGWSTTDYNSQESGWTPVRVLPFPTEELVIPESPPVQITESIVPKEILRSPSGKLLVDFGQNLVGKLWIRSLNKPEGDIISFKHAEVLENGELCMRPLRNAKCTDTILCSGKELVNWSPSFTFHGFRYVQIDGWAPEDDVCPLSNLSLTALVMHTDMKRLGRFTCSNELVNKLHENAVWGMRGNFLSIPTDCPQRDERLGWTGDIQAFCPSASYLYHTGGILGDWLKDLAVEQKKGNGVPPMIVPDVCFNTPPRPPQAVWGDAAVLVPWDLYRFTGDAKILDTQYESMKSWLDKGVRRGSDGLWSDSLWQHADWLDPSAPPDDAGNGATDGVLVADAYLVHSTEVMSKVATILGHQDDKDRYTSDYLKLKELFQRKYITPAGYVACDTQTALSLAIVFKLFQNSEQVKVAGERLVRRVRFARFRVSTGFAGTPLVTHALTMVGKSEIAYRMLLEQECPSWLYPVTMGATTIWERWNSMLPDGSINPGTMTSFNHYALGSIVNWLHQTVGGLSPTELGWKRFLVRPVPGGGITSAKTTYDSPFGLITCNWHLAGPGKFCMQLIIPPSATAYVILPDRQKHDDDISTERGIPFDSGEYEIYCDFQPRDWPPKALLTLFREDTSDDFEEPIVYPPAHEGPFVDLILQSALAHGALVNGVNNVTL